jgi:hypothetical protein
MLPFPHPPGVRRPESRGGWREARSPRAAHTGPDRHPVAAVRVRGGLMVRGTRDKVDTVAADQARWCGQLRHGAGVGW